MKTTFIYALKELAPGEFFSTKIRYIGKADDPYGRFVNHWNCKEKSRLGNWIRSLPAKGLSLQLEILDEVPDVKSEWVFWEREYIRVFRAIGFDLVNTSPGGEGFQGSHTAEALVKMRAVKLGKKASPETRAKMRAAHSGEKNHNFGKKLSLETREKLSAARRGQKPSPGTREKLRAANRGERNNMFGKKHSPETREKISAAKKGNNGCLGRKMSPETREKISKALRSKQRSL